MRKQEAAVTFLDLYKELMGEGTPAVGNATDAAALAAQAVAKANATFDADVMVDGGAYNIRTAEDGTREAVFVFCTEIAEDSFSVCEAVQDPATGRDVPVRCIAERAFWQAGDRLKEIRLPDSVTHICDEAFIMVPSLATIRMPKALEVLGEEVTDLTQVDELWIAKTVRDIAKPYLYNNLCWVVEEGNPYYKSDGVGLYRIVETSEAGSESVELVAVSRRPEVTSYTVSENTIRIQDHAFDENWYLQDIVLPEGVQHIGAEAFSGCASLEALTLPESLVSIGKEAFHGCAKLHRLTLGAAVTDLGSRCLTETFSGKRDNRGIFDVHVSSENPKFYVENEAFMAGSTLVKYLGDATDYTVNEGVTHIGEQAFLRSRPVHLSLPKTLEGVGKDAFWGMEEIESICIASDVTADGTAATIYIPQSPTYRKTEVCEGFYTHGTEERFDYAGYDASFSSFHTYADRCRMACTRLLYPFSLENEAMYRDWLAENVHAAVEDFAMREVKSFHQEEVCALHREILTELAQTGAIDAGNIDALVETANLVGATELLAELLSMKNDRFSDGFEGFDFSL